MNDHTAEIDVHLRHHLTDGSWHDSCGYCQRRRVHGGTGVPKGERVTPPVEGCTCGRWPHAPECPRKRVIPPASSDGAA